VCRAEARADGRGSPATMTHLVWCPEGPDRDRTPATIAAALREAGIDPDAVAEADDAQTVILDAGEDAGTLALGWTDTEHPDYDPALGADIIDWTTYNAAHESEQTYSDVLGGAVNFAREWAAARGILA
jgi:hypothetical protein